MLFLLKAASITRHSDWREHRVCQRMEVVVVVVVVVAGIQGREGALGCACLKSQMNARLGLFNRLL